MILHMDYLYRYRRCYRRKAAITTKGHELRVRVHDRRQLAGRRQDVGSDHHGFPVSTAHLLRQLLPLLPPLLRLLPPPPPPLHRFDLSSLFLSALLMLLPLVGVCCIVAPAAAAGAAAFRLLRYSYS